MSKKSHQPNQTNAIKPSWRFMLSHPVHLVSLGFGTGLSAIAPGTMGTLFAWFSFGLLDRYLTQGGWALLILTSFVLGAAAVGYTARKLGVEDPGGANLDEIVAFWLVLLFIMPASFMTQLMAFLLFRFFDIVKPQPIRYIEQRFSGGFGIMFDDVAAAFFTLLVMAIWQSIRLA